MARQQAKIRIVLDDIEHIEPARRPAKIVAFKSEKRMSEDDKAAEDARFREIEAIYLSGMLRGIAKPEDTRH
jgi:hypothetical protein